ncbi:uncharacterized protein LOC141843800 [Curcuma longa]|uniref:uncharacterized protein LOC141843800 n=1 Tax=Curcuma longa TaxID=136217 RepID=UPI003D9E70B9
MKQYDRERMKIAMLKQEEIFRYQVHELHRLYKIQKLSMTRHHELLDLALPGPAKKNSTLTVELEESDLELKLAAGSDGAPSKKNRAQLANDSGSSFSSSSNDGLFTGLRYERMGGCDAEDQARKEEIKQPHWLFQCSKEDTMVSLGL